MRSGPHLKRVKEGMLPRNVLFPLTLALACFPALAQVKANSVSLSRQPTPQQAARVQVAQVTAQVRELERTGGLHAAPVSAGCRTRTGGSMLRILKDSHGTTRLVRYVQLIPDNTVRFTGYYDAGGKLRYATGSASGFPGPLYNLTSEYDAQGNRLHESGFRRLGWNNDLAQMPGLNIAALARGECLR